MNQQNLTEQDWIDFLANAIMQAVHKKEGYTHTSTWEQTEESIKEKFRKTAADGVADWKEKELVAKQVINRMRNRESNRLKELIKDSRC